MATITMALDKSKGFDEFNKDENPKTLHTKKRILKIMLFTGVGSIIAFGGYKLIKNLNNPNPNKKNNITNVVKADSTETDKENKVYDYTNKNPKPDTIANYSDYVKKQNPDSSTTDPTPPDTIPKTYTSADTTTDDFDPFKSNADDDLADVNNQLAQTNNQLAQVNTEINKMVKDSTAVADVNHDLGIK